VWIQVHVPSLSTRTGEKLNTIGPEALTILAAKHLKEDNGGILAISHAEQPQSMYDNHSCIQCCFLGSFRMALAAS